MTNKFFASDGTGTYGSKPVKLISAADSNGTLQPVTNAWAFKDGAWVKVFPFTAQFNFFSVAPLIGATYFYMSANNVSNYRVVRVTPNGSESFLFDASYSPYYANGYWIPPGETQTFRLYGYGAAAVGEADSWVLMGEATGTGPALPAPTGVTATSITSSGATISWTASEGATSYKIVQTNKFIANGIIGPVYGTVTLASGITNNSYALTGLTDDTTYQIAVVAVNGSHESANSTQINFKTLVARLPAGTYYIKPKSAYVDTSGSWRPTSVGYYHGNNGDSYGNQATFFFYYDSTGVNPFAAFKGRTAANIEFYMLRSDSATGGSGSTAAMTGRWRIHKHPTKPSAPVYDDYIGSGSNTFGGTQAPTGDNSFLKNEGNWVGVPDGVRDNWMTALTNGTRAGIAWGGSTNQYMTADRNLSATYPNGTIRITIT